MKTTLIILLIIVLLIGGIYAIKWVPVLMASDYDEMLDALYSKTVPVIKPDTLSNLDNYLVLDTRAAKEWKVSSIKGATWVGYPKTDLKVVEGLAKDQAILVYCSVGYRSERVGEQLIKMGYTNVYNLYGGIFEWLNTKHLVVDQQNKEIKKVHGYEPSWGKWIRAEINIVYD